VKSTRQDDGFVRYTKARFADLYRGAVSSVFPPPSIAQVYRRADWAADCGLHTMVGNEHMIAFPARYPVQPCWCSLVPSRSLLLSFSSRVLSHFSEKQPFATCGSCQRQEQKSTRRNPILSSRRTTASPARCPVASTGELGKESSQRSATAAVVLRP
jgi:hypothetical protein